MSQNSNLRLKNETLTLEKLQNSKSNSRESPDIKSTFDINTIKIEDVEMVLVGIYKKLVDDFEHLQCRQRTFETVEESHQTIEKYRNYLDTIKKHAEKMYDIVTKCDEFTKNLEDDIDSPRSEDFVYQTKRFMLNYKMPDHRVKLKELPEKIEQSTINIAPIGYSMTLPIIKTMEELHKQHSIYFCEETKCIWMVLPGSNLMKIPFPEIIDCTKVSEKANSIRCRHQTKSSCSDNKQGFWTCSYTHLGEKMVKLGYSVRCPSVPNFGNPTTIRKDITYVKLPDVKSLLMYGLNDIITAAVWLDYNGKKNQRYENLDKG